VGPVGFSESLSSQTARLQDSHFQFEPKPEAGCRQTRALSESVLVYLNSLALDAVGQPAAE
jgi:hypothetical protein